MNRFFGQESRFARFMNLVGNMIGVTLMWMLTSLPVVTAGASGIALYKTTVKCVRHGEGYPVKEFFGTFRKSLKDGIIMTLLFMLLGAVLALDRMYTDRLQTQTAAAMSLLYTLLILVAISVLIYLWPVMSRFDMGKWSCFRMALLMVFRHLPYTLAFWAIWLAGVFLMTWIPVPMLFVLPGACSYAQSFLMERLLRRYMAKPRTEEEKMKWYYK